MVPRHQFVVPVEIDSAVIQPTDFLLCAIHATSFLQLLEKFPVFLSTHLQTEAAKFPDCNQLAEFSWRYLGLYWKAPKMVRSSYEAPSPNICNASGAWDPTTHLSNTSTLPWTSSTSTPGQPHPHHTLYPTAGKKEEEKAFTLKEAN